MKYSKVDYFEIVNGTNIGVSLYTQGCERHCKGCFNEAAWDLEGGNDYTIEVRDDIVNACCRPGIKRFSVVGGEPLLERNKEELIALCSLVKEANPDISIWVYTGDTYENVKDEWNDLFEPFVDVLVDGPFILEQRDITLPFRGSTNQRLVDIKKTIEKGEIVLYE